ncbi:hypothetical protein, conserved [Eimeria brunetti]|uniref:Uncharacterized protein n=1 Tax=Eimeria brunetti TaxID=51314 RepID=U6M0Y2_9EIME|nr:hypothetical protein, conserved [Eimeria brunetti]
MERLWQWLLLVAAVEIGGGQAGGSIGLAVTAMASETTSSTRDSDNPVPYGDAELSVLEGHHALSRGDTETALSWDDDVTKTVSFPCSTCSTAAGETAPAKVEAEISVETVPTNTVELSTGLGATGAPVAVPLRGVKSLVSGFLLLSVLLFIINAPDEVDNEDGAFTALHHFFAEGMIDGMFAIDDLLEEKAPVFPFKIFSFWILAGAAPILFLSGLINVVHGLKRRRQRQSLPGPRFSGLPLKLVAALLSMWVTMLPVYTNADDDDGPLLEERGHEGSGSRRENINQDNSTLPAGLALTLQRFWTQEGDAYYMRQTLATVISIPPRGA